MRGDDGVRGRSGPTAVIGVFSLAALAVVSACGSTETSPTAASLPLPATVPPTTVASPAPATTLPSPIVPPPTTLPPPGTGNLPATTVVMAPVRDDALVDAAVPVEVTSPCPASDPGAGSEAMTVESARLEPMLGQVLAYGGQHPESFGSYGLIWSEGGDASVFISFTTDLDGHRAALDALVPYPDELIVCQVAVSGAVSRALIAKLTDELQGRFLSIGIGIGSVRIVLKPGEDALAADLVEAYGDAVAVEVCPDEQSCSVPMV